MTRTITHRELTAHLTDEQRATIRAGIDAAQRTRDVVAGALPAIMRAVYVIETELPVDPDGNEIEAWWQASGSDELQLADAVGEALQWACSRPRTDVDVEAVCRKLILSILPDCDD